MRWMGALAASLAVVTACMSPETEVGTEPAAEEAAAGASLIEEGVTLVDVTLAEGKLALSQDSIPAGTVAFQVRNGGTAEHAFAVKGTGGDGEWKTDPLAPGGIVTMSLNLEPGVYEVDSPAAAGGTTQPRGMRTRLRVY